MRISTAQHILASHTKTPAVITNLSALPSPQHPLLQTALTAMPPATNGQLYYSRVFKFSTQQFFDKITSQHRKTWEADFKKVNTFFINNLIL